MKYLGMLRELEVLLNQYTATNMIGKNFDYAKVRMLCENLKEADPEKFSSFVTKGTDHELMVSVSNFFMKLLNV